MRIIFNREISTAMSDEIEDWIDSQNLILSKDWGWALFKSGIWFTNAADVIAFKIKFGL